MKKFSNLVLKSSLLSTGILIGYFSKPIIDDSLEKYQFLRSAQIITIDSTLENKFERDINVELERKNSDCFEISVNDVEIYQKNGDYLIRGKSNDQLYEIGLQSRKAPKNKTQYLSFKKVN